MKLLPVMTIDIVGHLMIINFMKRPPALVLSQRFSAVSRIANVRSDLNVLTLKTTALFKGQRRAWQGA